MNATQAIIFYPVLGAFLLISIRCWWWMAEKWFALEPWLEKEHYAAANTGMIDVFVAMMAWAGAGTISTVLFMRLNEMESFKAAELNIEQYRQLVVMASAAQLVAVISVGLWLALRYGFRSQSTGVKWGQLIYDVRVGVIAFFAAAPFIYGLQALLSWLIPYKHPLVELVRDDGSSLSFLAIASAAVIAAPITEEFWFRWILQGWLDKIVRAGSKPDSKTGIALLMGGSGEEPVPGNQSLKDKSDFAKTPPKNGALSWLPILASSLVFAAIHYGHGPAPIPLFFLALLLGWLMRQTGRITACIVVHFMLNSCTTILLLIEVLTQPAVEPEPIIAWFLIGIG